MLMLVILLVLSPSIVFGMEPKNKQLEICPGRRAYIQSVAIKQVDPVCPFCDPANLAKNFILREDKQKDVREIMNLNSYLPRHRGKHVVIMPISHIKSPIDLSSEQLASQSDSVQQLSIKLHQRAYVQEFFANFLRPAGASIENHWHTQLISFEMPPASLPECLQQDADADITSIEQAFHAMKECLAENDSDAVAAAEVSSQRCNCLCCSISMNRDNHEQNLVVGETEFHIICLSHHPSVPGEVAVVPKRHVPSIKDLSQNEFRENMALATALLFKVKEYAQENIRDCGGANFYTKSIGGKSSIEKQEKHHVHTVVMPRTTIVATPGTLEGNSCKLDMDPLHFMEWLKDKMGEVIARI